MEITLSNNTIIILSYTYIYLSLEMSHISLTMYELLCSQPDTKSLATLFSLPSVLIILHDFCICASYILAFISAHNSIIHEMELATRQKL